jgi:hypothetical protein
LEQCHIASQDLYLEENLQLNTFEQRKAQSSPTTT